MSMEKTALSKLLKIQVSIQRLSSLAVILLTIVNLSCRLASNLVLPATPTNTVFAETIFPSPPSPTTTLPPTTTPVSLPSPTPFVSPTQAEDELACDGILAFRLLKPPERTKDLFEHHAQGVFLILHLEAINLTQNPIQIYGDDYTLILPQENNEISLRPHKAATNYLYIVRGDNFYQDKIKAASIWRTYLAFDIPPTTTDWKLFITPGSGGSPTICQTTLLP